MRDLRKGILYLVDKCYCEIRACFGEVMIEGGLDIELGAFASDDPL